MSKEGRVSAKDYRILTGQTTDSRVVSVVCPRCSETVELNPHPLYNAGDEQPPADLAKWRAYDGDQKLNRWSHWIWRRYASSVWDDVRGTRVLPFQDAKDEDDEKHVHPLQLDVIERFIDLRTVPGEKVFTPFMGVGSEVYGAVRMGRFGIGAELKKSYFIQATRNMETVDRPPEVVTEPLFDESWEE
jgi:DNA modification methylase